MYDVLLRLHSFTRWLVLLSLLFAIFTAYKGWLGKKPFTAFANKVRHITATIAHVQLLLGLLLYFISPLVQYFLTFFKEAVHQREYRFFGMEHASMMLIAVTLITIGSSSAKRKTNDKVKYRIMALWFTAALLVIISSIPWPFSPVISRPWIR